MKLNKLVLFLSITYGLCLNAMQPQQASATYSPQSSKELFDLLKMAQKAPPQTAQEWETLRAKARDLLKNSADPNYSDLIRGGQNTKILSYRTPLIFATRDEQLVDILLHAGADPNLIPNDIDREQSQERSFTDIYKSPLHQAVIKNNYPGAEKLIAAGANINLQDTQGDSGLHNASNNEAALIKFYLDHNANPNIQNNAGVTPLMEAVERKQPSIISLLLEAGADRFIKNAKGKTALDIAKEKNVGTAIEMLLIGKARKML